MAKAPVFRAEGSQDLGRKAWIYQLDGKFIGCPEAYDFLETARDNLSEVRPNVILLMGNLSFVNSTGIGMLAALLTSSQKFEGKLCVIGVPGTAQRQLEVTRLWDFLTSADDLDGLPL